MAAPERAPAELTLRAGRKTIVPMGGYPRLGGALPLVGHMPEMLRHFPELCARGEREHGSLFWIEGGPGAEQLMIAHRDGVELLKQRAMSTSFYEEGFGPMLADTLFVYDDREHRRVRGLMAPAFTPSRIRRTDVITIIDEVVQRHVGRWIDKGGFDAIRGTKEIALEIIFRIVGVPKDNLPVWRKHFERYRLTGLPAGGWVLRPFIRTGERSRDWLDERMGAMVDRHRETGDESTLLGAIANRRDEDGQWLDRKMVVANLRLLVLAGHETTAATLAWSLLHQANAPDIARRAAEETAAPDAGDDVVDWAARQFLEAARLYPTVHSVIRRLREDLEVDDRVVPSGTLVNLPLTHMLRDPVRFPEPAQYRPARWTELPKPGSAHTAMFGGGPHFCLGYHIAMAEGVRFHRHLVRALARRGLHLRARKPVPRPVYLPLTHAPGIQPVVIER